MLVVQQLFLDERLEESALLAFVLEAGAVRVEVERAVRVATVVVGRKAAEEHLQRVREAGVGPLALLELEVVDGGIEMRLVEAVLDQSLEGSSTTRSTF